MRNSWLLHLITVAYTLNSHGMIFEYVIARWRRPLLVITDYDLTKKSEMVT